MPQRKIVRIELAAIYFSNRHIVSFRKRTKKKIDRKEKKKKSRPNSKRFSSSSAVIDSDGVFCVSHLETVYAKLAKPIHHFSMFKTHCCDDAIFYLSLQIFEGHPFFVLFYILFCFYHFDSSIQYVCCIKVFTIFIRIATREENLSGKMRRKI